MTALAADRNTKEAIGDMEVFPVAGTTKIYAGSSVGIKPDGYAAPGADLEGMKAVGRAEEMVDNSGGADGDLTIKVKRGIFEFTGAGFTIADVGKEVFISDDQTVALRTDNHVLAGRIEQYLSATSVYVDMRSHGSAREFMITRRIAGATAANYDDCFIAPFGCELVEAKEVHDDVGTDGGSVECGIEKLTGTQTPGNGVDMLASDFDLKATKDTVLEGALHATIANRQLAEGDRIALKDTGTLTAVGNVIVTLVLRKI